MIVGIAWVLSLGGILIIYISNSPLLYAIGLCAILIGGIVFRKIYYEK